MALESGGTPSPFRLRSQWQLPFCYPREFRPQSQSSLTTLAALLLNRQRPQTIARSIDNDFTTPIHEFKLTLNRQDGEFYPFAILQEPWGRL